jgi:hypothetical protein
MSDVRFHTFRFICSVVNLPDKISTTNVSSTTKNNDSIEETRMIVFVYNWFKLQLNRWNQYINIT